jgi:CheY-like chemotaxis protein/HPt (histidine-containing phosphotransfer) domain-containing protein
LQGVRLLIVDDEETVRMVLQEQLEAWGLFADSASNGRQALEALQEKNAQGAPYDIAILDLTMPDIDGMELARTIKADPSIALTRLVILTGHAQRGDGAEARKAGVSAYLVKPVTNSQMFDCISRVMNASEKTPLITRHSLKELRVLEMASIRILVADDDEVNRKVAKGILERFGYQADFAENGKEAVELSSSVPYDLILMDCSMPEMDGFQATAEIRRREKESKSARRMPIIALTAHAMKGFREKCIETGMEDYLSKPFNREDLKTVLDRWLNSGASNPQRKLEPSVEDSPDEDTQTVSVDENTIQALRETMGDDLEKVFQLFCQQTQERIGAMKAAVTQRDADTLHRVSHSLKGSAGLIGAVRMTALSEELQSLGSSEKVDGADELLDMLADEFETVQSLLQAEN